MSIKIGTLDIDDIKLGNADVDRVMQGAVEVWSREVACIDLPAESAAFIADPPDYTRDGINYSTVSLIPDGIFPDGPRPFIGAHNAQQSRYQGLADNGFTVIGSTYAVFDTLSQVTEAARLGMKMVFPFRDYNLPLDQNNHGGFADLGYAGQQLIAGNSAPFNNLKLCFDAVYDLVSGDATANDTVIGWSNKCDDALSLPEYDGYTVQDYHAFSREMFPYFIQKDSRNRGCFDLPQKGYAYRNFADVDYTGGTDLGGWQVSQSMWSAQIYWQDGVDVSKGATKSFITRATHVESINRMIQLDEHVGPAPNGELRRFIPLIWLQGNVQSGTSGYTTAQQDTWRKNTRTCDILTLMMAGAHGFNYFGWNPEVSTPDWPDGWFGFSYTEEANLLALMKTLTDANVIEGLLWGADTGDVTKTALTDSTYIYWIEKSNNLCGPCDGPRDCGGVEGQSCGYGGTEMILWKSFQFQGARYLVVTNMMPNPDVIAHWESTGDNFPPIGSNGNADYVIQSRFNLPSLTYEGLQCIDVLTGDDAAVTGEFNSSANTITVTLDHAESRVYKFAPADGYCGGDEPDTNLPWSSVPSEIRTWADGVTSSTTLSQVDVADARWNNRSNGEAYAYESEDYLMFYFPSATAQCNFNMVSGQVDWHDSTPNCGGPITVGASQGITWNSTGEGAVIYDRLQGCP